MEKLFKHEQLPSGKIIIRQFADDGSVIVETHRYGALEIAIKYDFREGVKIDETYFSKRRIVGRRTYEKARAAYADMPVAEDALRDYGAELLRALARERRQRNIEAKKRQPDPDEARKLDEFCSALMEKGRSEDAVRWVQTRKHTLGERNWSASKRLVERLLALGCVQIYACEIDVYEDGLENAGHMVIELPEDAVTRGKILKAIGRLASETGCSGDFDDGQQYAYVKLD